MHSVIHQLIRKQFYTLRKNKNELLTLQGVPTSFEYAKCNVMKLWKVCERSELRLQKDPIKRGNYDFWPNKKGWILNFDPTKKGEILNFDPVTSLKLLISPYLLGQYFVNVARFARKFF